LYGLRCNALICSSSITQATLRLDLAGNGLDGWDMSVDDSIDN
jgi:hypothetical protein